MFLLGLYFYLALYASSALASRVAGPYQAVLFFFAYRMDIDAHGVGGANGAKLASGCRGSVGDGSCYFDEFLRHIATKVKGKPWAGSTSIGTDLDPDIETAAQELQDTKYPGLIKPHVLFPHIADFDPQAKVDPKAEKKKRGFPQIIKALADRIQASRQTVKDDAKLSTALDKCRDSIALVLYACNADHAAAEIAGVNELIEREMNKVGRPPFTVQTREVTFPRFTWLKVDPAATLRTCVDCDQVLHDAIVQYSTSFNNADGNNEAHFAAIKATSAQGSRIHKGLIC